MITQESFEKGVIVVENISLRLQKNKKQKPKEQKEEGKMELRRLDAGAFRRTVQRARSGSLTHFALSHWAKLPKFHV